MNACPAQFSIPCKRCWLDLVVRQEDCGEAQWLHVHHDICSIQACIVLGISRLAHTVDLIATTCCAPELQV